MTANDNGHRRDGVGRPVRRIPPLALVLLLAGTLPAFAKVPPASFADLAAKLLPSVVNISTTQKVRADDGNRPAIPRFAPGSPFERFFRDFFDRQQQSPMPRQGITSLGSGFVIDASGVIVTNNHVIAEADKIAVILSDKTRLEAKVIGRDAKTDIALLRVDPGGKRLKPLGFGDSDGSRVGDWVIAIGNPFGLGGTVTAGIVSARQRDINSGPYDDFIQTDASINRGNSGGPMFNLDGRGHRHQHGDLLAHRGKRRHRFRDPLQPREADRRPAAEIRPRPAGLSRRAHPDRDRGNRPGTRPSLRVGRPGDQPVRGRPRRQGEAGRWATSS